MMTAKTIYAIHTGPVLVDVIRSLAKELMPEVRVVNVVDDGLLAEVREAGELTTAVSRRLVGYGVIAAASGADAILNCCSSVGEAAELLQKVVAVPVVRIDDAMARQAAKLGPRIAVVATLATTLEPTRRLIARRANEERHDVKLTSYVAGEAFDSLLAGNGARHDALVNEVIDRAMRENDVVVLAQGSMARLVAAREPGDVPVLTSPREGVKSLYARLQGKQP